MPPVWSAVRNNQTTSSTHGCIIYLKRRSRRERQVGGGNGCKESAGSFRQTRDIFSLIYIHLPVEFYIFFLHLLALLLATYCENTDARTVDDVG